MANLGVIFSWIVLLDYFMRKKRKVNEVENARITKFNFVYWNREKSMGNQRPNVSKYARSVSNGFLCALEARLANLELP